MNRFSSHNGIFLNPIGIFSFCISIVLGCSYSEPEIDDSFSRNTASTNRSVTREDGDASKYLISLAVGLNVPATFTLQLRNNLSPILTSVRGGNYKLIMDVSDKEGSVVPTKANVNQEIDRVAQEIFKSRFKNPDKPVMVMILLTGHGSLDNDSGQYRYHLGWDDNSTDS